MPDIPDTNPAPGAVAPAPAVAPTGALIKVLFLDDDQYIRKIYEDRLKSAGFDVTIASNGTQALNIAKEAKFDVIVVDMVMPDMTGTEVIKGLRQMPEHAKTKLIVFSALGQDKTIEEAKAAGADDFLIKDKIMPSDLANKIISIIK